MRKRGIVVHACKKLVSNVLSVLFRGAQNVKGYSRAVVESQRWASDSQWAELRKWGRGSPQ